MKPVQISSSAAQDIRIAVEYYAEQGASLTRVFMDDFERACSLIAQASETGSPVEHGFRKIVKQRYPFVVIYRHEKSRSMVFAVGHQRRNPDFWLRRV